MAETEEKKYLINVESNLDEYVKDLQKTNVEVEKFKEAQKEAEKQSGKNSEEYIKATAQLKSAQTEQRQATSTLTKMTTAKKASGTSYNDLHKQWVAAELTLKNLQGTIIRNADGTITLSEAYKKAKIESENAKKAVDQFNLGVNNGTSSVGQYSKGMQDALKQTGLFGGAFNVIGDVKSKFTGAVEGVKKFSGSFSTVKAAIASTGIGLLIIAIGSLFTWFTKSAEGSKILKQAMAAVNEVFNTFIGTLSKVGALLKDFITGDWDKLKSDAKGIGDEWKNIGKNMKEAADIAKMEIELGKARRKAVVNEAELTRDIAKARLDAADKLKTNAQRVDALRKSLELEKELTKEKIAISQQEYDTVYKRIKLQESHNVKASKDDKDRLAELTAAKINAEGEEFQRSRRAVTQITSLQKEMQQAVFNEKKKLVERDAILAEGNYALTKKNIEDAFRLELSGIDVTRNQKLLLRAQFDKSIRELDKQYFGDRKKDDEEYVKFLSDLNNEVLSSEKDRDAKLLEQKKNDGAARVETARINADNEFAVNAQANQNNAILLAQDQITRLETLRSILDEENEMLVQSDEYKKASVDQRALWDAQYAAQRIAISNDIVNAEIATDKILRKQREQTFAATADLLGATSELIGKETLAGKSMAIAQAVINTYLAASNALASAPNPIIGAIQVAAAVAIGLAQVKQIMAVKVGKNANNSVSGGGGSGRTVSASFTAANQNIASSQVQSSRSDRLGGIQQNANNQAVAINTAQQPIRVESVISVEAFQSQAEKKNQVEVKSNI